MRYTIAALLVLSAPIGAGTITLFYRLDMLTGALLGFCMGITAGLAAFSIAWRQR